MRRDYDTLPPEIREQGVDFHWDNRKIWALDLPVEEIETSLLEWQLDLPFWAHEGVKYRLCPRLVLEDLEAYPDHKDRVLSADIRYPIDIIENPGGRLEILDGVHRLVRLMREGHRRVKVRRIPRQSIPLIEI
ncbi:MAG: hypothetical protein WC453_01315 [Patescibacteria group bacterium]